LFLHNGAGLLWIKVTVEPVLKLVNPALDKSNFGLQLLQPCLLRQILGHKPDERSSSGDEHDHIYA
jgi:hypothetical protein